MDVAGPWSILDRKSWRFSTFNFWLFLTYCDICDIPLSANLQIGVGGGYGATQQMETPGDFGWKQKSSIGAASVKWTLETRLCQHTSQVSFCSLMTLSVQGGLVQLHPCFAGDPIWSLQLSSSVLHTSLRAKLRCDVIHFGCFYIKVVAATCKAFVFPPSKQHGAPLKKAFAINFLLEEFRAGFWGCKMRLLTFRESLQRQDSTHFSARCRLHPFP